MAKLANLLRIPVRPERAVLQALSQLERDKIPIRVEIENNNTRFYSILSLKRGLVVVAKPPGLKGGLDREGYVRFKVPNSDGKELRMQITVPHFNLLSGGYVFLCSVPKEFADSSQRGAERYNTGRFNNLFLFLPSIKGHYRITDISETGCKVFMDSTAMRDVLEMGKPISPASIAVGNKVDIELQSATPRSRVKSTVGFELKVDGDGPSNKYLAHFLKSLEASEATRLKADQSEGE